MIIKKKRQHDFLTIVSNNLNVCLLIVIVGGQHRFDIHWNFYDRIAGTLGKLAGLSGLLVLCLLNRISLYKFTHERDIA